jgi:hypothetical protein
LNAGSSRPLPGDDTYNLDLWKISSPCSLKLFDTLAIWVNILSYGACREIYQDLFWVE